MRARQLRSSPAPRPSARGVGPTSPCSADAVIAPTKAGVSWGAAGSGVVLAPGCVSKFPFCSLCAAVLRARGLGGGVAAGGGAYGEELDRLHSLPRNHGYRFVFTQECRFGWCEAGGEGERHGVCACEEYGYRGESGSWGAFKRAWGGGGEFSRGVSGVDCEG